MQKQTAYQDHYQSMVGSAVIDRKEVVAGSTISMKLNYQVGTYGIDETGMLKILFRIATDMGRPQFDDPKMENYVYATSSNKGVVFTLSGVTNGRIGKQDVRPWCRGFSVHVGGSYLEEGDEVNIFFSNWSVQTYTEKNFEFRVLVDPFATAKFVRMEKPPKMSIISGKPEMMHIILPSKTEPNKVFKTFVKLEDSWGNVCTSFSGNISLNFKSTSFRIPKEVAVLSGSGEVETVISEVGLHTVVGSLGNVQARSNPSVCTTDKIAPYFWADLHGQTGETVGTNTVEDYFLFAREYGRLDIVCHQANDFQITNAFWNKINALTKANNSDGNFIVFPGYEWSGNSSVGGDHNVIYRQEGQPLYRSSHALVDNLNDVETDATTITELCKKLNRKETFLIAHAGGRYANLQKHSEATPPDAIEIHSDWGTFEWLLRDAFDQNFRVGIVANSDGHKGTPGASYPGSFHFGSQGGLTCVRANSLSRNDVFAALKARHTYATTGVRILLNFSSIDTSGNTTAEMGDVLEVLEGPVQFSIRTVTTTPLERVEVYRKNTLIKTFYPDLDRSSNEKIIKIMFSGASAKGRSRKFKWNGFVNTSRNTFTEIEKLNFYSKKDEVTRTYNEIQILGTTTGGCQGFIAHLAKKSGWIQINVNEQDISLNLSSITHEVKRYEFEGLDTKMEVYEAPKKTGSCTGEYELLLEEVPEVETPFFVKIIQRDGHIAWSSPIYITKK